MGELVYQLKYKSNKKALPEIIKLLDKIKGIEDFDFIIPIPPTNKGREIQPAEEIALALGEKRKVKVLKKFLVNEGDQELKGITDPIAREEMLREALKINSNKKIEGKNILLVDDLFRSGTTLQVATDLLYKESKVAKVCVLTMTKTRSNR